MITAGTFTRILFHVFGYGEGSKISPIFSLKNFAGLEMPEILQKSGDSGFGVLSAFA